MGSGGHQHRSDSGSAAAVEWSGHCRRGRSLVPHNAAAAARLAQVYLSLSIFHADAAVILVRTCDVCTTSVRCP